MKNELIPMYAPTDIKSAITMLQETANTHKPELTSDINQVSGMLKTYERLPDKAILEMIIIELGTIIHKLMINQPTINHTTLPEINKQLDWKVLIEKFVMYMNDEEKLSESSIRIYRAAIKNLLNYDETLTVSTDDIVAAAKKTLETLDNDKNKETKKQNRNNISALRVFLRFTNKLNSNVTQ